MKSYVVSIDIVTPSLVTRHELADLLGVSTPSALDDRPGREAGTVSWRYEPAYPDKTMTLADYVNFIASDLRPGRPIRIGKKIKDIYLDIGVFYYSVACTVSLPMHCLASLKKKIPELGVGIRCYPCREDEGEEEEDKQEAAT